jgi:general L-amino acid transport system substrate-binding protein
VQRFSLLHTDVLHEPPDKVSSSKWRAEAGTLDKIKERGVLVCGTNTGLAGFALPDSQGIWKGLDVDNCKALAAAIFNDPTKIKYLPINAKDRRPFWRRARSMC